MMKDEKFIPMHIGKSFRVYKKQSEKQSESRDFSLCFFLRSQTHSEFRNQIDFYSRFSKTVIKLLGDDTVQGRLFGFKETGFAAFALMYSSLALQLFKSADESKGVLGLKYVIWAYSAVLIVSGIISYIFIPLYKKTYRFSK